jgi:hypothetical protein
LFQNRYLGSHTRRERLVMPRLRSSELIIVGRQGDQTGNWGQPVLIRFLKVIDVRSTVLDETYTDLLVTDLQGVSVLR